jgi:hypothetical protein
VDAVPLILVEIEQDQEFEETGVVAQMRLAIYWSETHEPLVGLGFLCKCRRWVV